VSYVGVNAAVVLQFLLMMQTCQFSVQVEINIFLELSPFYLQFRLVFFFGGGGVGAVGSMCHLPSLFLSRIDPAARNIFAYLKIFFVLGTRAPENFGPNLRHYILYDSHLAHYRT
jgi:hypothetical protein